MIEKWKPVVGFEGLYEVSNLGKLYSHRCGRMLALTPDKDGYLCVSFFVEGTRWLKKIHRLVLEAFYGSCPKGMQCRHLDGNRTNNCITNLAWGTSKQDAADRIKHGVHVRGDRLRTAKLSNEKVRYILKTNKSSRELAKKFNVVYTVIDKVKRREIWKHVSV